MQTVMKIMMAGALACATCAGPSWAVNHLNFDQLVSLVFFEDENAHLDPTGFFCRFIALSHKDDFCKVTMTYVDPKLCKVEITRELRATYSDGKLREFLRSRDVFTLANLDLTKLKEAEVDEAAKSYKQTFTEPLDVKWHEGHQYTFALDPQGQYRSCVVDGADSNISETACVQAGTKGYVGSKTMSLIFNADTYNRAMAALRWLQTTYCPKGDAL